MLRCATARLSTDARATAGRVKLTDPDGNRHRIGPVAGLTSHVRQEATTADLSPPSRSGPLIWMS